MAWGMIPIQLMSSTDCDWKTAELSSKRALNLYLVRMKDCGRCKKGNIYGAGIGQG
jgi:hypothetical protein